MDIVGVYSQHFLSGRSVHSILNSSFCKSNYNMIEFNFILKVLRVNKCLKVQCLSRGLLRCPVKIVFKPLEEDGDKDANSSNGFLLFNIFHFFLLPSLKIMFSCALLYPSIQCLHSRASNTTVHPGNFPNCDAVRPVHLGSTINIHVKI